MLQTTNQETQAKLLEVGDEYRYPFSYSQEDINRFAEVTGDTNPIHIDSDYAAQTMFKRTIMHGFLGGSVFSKVFGTLFPGEGTIYLQQNMKFMRPMFPSTKYEVVMTVKEIVREKNTATITTSIVDTETGKSTIEGEAVVMNKTRI